MMDTVNGSDWTPADIQHKQFRKRLMGLDPREVEQFLQMTSEEMAHLRMESAEQRRRLGEQEKELKEYREREKTIRNVLINAHKTVEQMKANAERESKLIIADAELKAEKMLQSTHQRLAQLHQDIAELKRQKIQLESRLRSTIESYQQMLDMQKENEAEGEP
ncbi:MAG: DivIVA domain-containing protein [Syntrophobacteraceae bacterium]|jgi:cell division initiation protein|nr:DivIVA domain-containing protein [Syntrophobacteraceae bacterium]